MISQQAQGAQGTEPVTGVTVDERRKELNRLIAQKQELEALYTSDHPDVVAISRKIADIEKVIARVPAGPEKVSDSPQLQQLKAQLRAEQQSMAAAKEEQGRIENQVRTYESRITI
jgi:hypothetical protein